MDAIVADLDERRHPFHVAIENWQHDMNIGSIVRSANAFLAAEVHIIGARRWNRRGAMVTDRYQHVRHHETVEAFIEWADAASLPVIAIDNVEGSVPLDRRRPARALRAAVRAGGTRALARGAGRGIRQSSRSRSTARPARSTRAPPAPSSCTSGAAAGREPARRSGGSGRSARRRAVGGVATATRRARGVSTKRARSETTPAARRREGMKRRKNTSRSSHASAPVKGMPYSSAMPLAEAERGRAARARGTRRAAAPAPLQLARDRAADVVAALDGPQRVGGHRRPRSPGARPARASPAAHTPVRDGERAVASAAGRARRATGRARGCARGAARSRPRRSPQRASCRRTAPPSVGVTSTRRAAGRTRDAQAGRAPSRRAPPAAAGRPTRRGSRLPECTRVTGCPRSAIAAASSAPATPPPATTTGEPGTVARWSASAPISSGAAQRAAVAARGPATSAVGSLAPGADDEVVVRQRLDRRVVAAAVRHRRLVGVDARRPGRR